MINHWRTLLLNGTGPVTATAPGEEYVPASFVAVPLPAPLLAARVAIFGGNADRRMLLYRTRQLLACLHASPLERAAFDLDPRVTYLPLPRGGFELPPVLTATPLGHTYPLTISGTPPAERSGVTTYSWLVATVAGPIATITPATGTVTATSLTYQSGRAMLAIPGTALTCSLPVVPVGTTWLITVAVNPTADLATVATNLAGVGAPALAALFDGGIEPYQSWANLWASRRPLPERLAAIASALVYRTDAIRVETAG